MQLGIAEVDQHTWAASKARLPADAIAIAIEAPAIVRQMLLSIEQPLLLQALECLLGGQAAQAPSERHLTDVDQACSPKEPPGHDRQASCLLPGAIWVARS